MSIAERIIAWLEVMAIAGPVTIVVGLSVVAWGKRDTMPPIPFTARWRTRQWLRRLRAARSSRPTVSSPQAAGRPQTLDGAGAPDPAPSRQHLVEMS